MADTAILGLSRSRLGLSWPLLMLAAGFLLTLADATATLGDPDIFWHIVTGRWIIAHGAVPHADFLSHTVPGTPWVAHEWLAEVIMATAYDSLGWHGLVAFEGLCVGVALALFTRALLRHLQPIHALLAVVAGGMLLIPHLLARPHIIALPLLVLWLSALVEARDDSRVPPPALALAMIPWVNLHASFLVGLGFAGLLMAEAVVAAPSAGARWAAARGWGAFIALAVLATQVTPNGIEAYLLPMRLLHMEYTLSILVEWQSPNFQSYQPLEAWLLAAFFGALGLGIRLPAARLMMVLLLVHLALKHGRHGELLGFAAPLLMAAPVAAQLARRGGGEGVAWLDRQMAELARPASAAGMALAALVLTAASAVTAAMPLKPVAKYLPDAAVQAVLDHHIAGPVFNEYAFGGYLIFAGIPTFIDGRADMYGDAFIERAFKAARVLSNEMPKLLDEYRIAWTLFPPGSQAAVVLDLLPDWKRLYADDIAVVHVRRDIDPAE